MPTRRYKYNFKEDHLTAKILEKEKEKKKKKEEKERKEQRKHFNITLKFYHI